MDAVGAEAFRAHRSRTALLAAAIWALAVLVGQPALGSALEETQLFELARRAGLDHKGLRVGSHPLFGTHLHGPDVYVLPEGVVRAEGKRVLYERAFKAHEAARERLDRAVSALTRSLRGTELGLASREALRDILAQLGRRDGGDLDFVPPEFARRLVRHGWPGGVDLPAGELRELREAVSEAERLLPLERYVGSGARLEWLGDALDRRVWLLSTAERSGYARDAPSPAYFRASGPVDLVVRLPVGLDPLRDAEQWVAAELHHESRRIAAFDAERFSWDPEGWREAYPTGVAGADPGALPDALPPHVLVVRADGDVLALVTAHGVVRPARDASAAAAREFYAQAAAALPDAAHLDLIGEHLVVYAYDSPDSRFPQLLGTREHQGDIHQTAPQTLATQTGGVYRGDCDDLSELYQEITRLQGRTAHLIGLPAHAALAWTERDPDGWRTYVLHTGQPRVFPAPTLEQSLELTYKSFGSGEVLDFTKLEILLRFSGENTRSSWYLSQRIFADPAYARSMIDVQRDWHFQTYQRAILKMTRMIESGDADPANYSELAGLYHYTGQYAEAARSLEAAIAAAPSPQTRISMQTDRVLALYRAGQREAGRALAQSLIREQIPALERAMGEELIDPRLGLAEALLHRDADAALALDVLYEEVLPRVDPLIDQVAGLLAAGDRALARWLEGASDPLRYQLRWYVAASVAALNLSREEPLASHPGRAALAASVEQWIQHVAFRDLDPAESLAARYALVGRYYRGSGKVAHLYARLSAASLPLHVGLDHAQRGSGQRQIERDLRWIALSPVFWWSELAGLFGEEYDELDRDTALQFSARFERARLRARELGLDHPDFERLERNVRLLGALLERRPAELRRLLRDAQQRDDRRDRMEVASWIAASARALPIEWYAEVLAIWREELNYKPMYFWIAWNAALTGAPEHALLVAEVAAEEFGDDPSFVEEYAFMGRRFGQLGPAR